MEVSLDFQIEYVKLVKLGKKAKPARKDLLNEQLAKLTASYHCLVERIVEIGYNDRKTTICMTRGK